MIDKIMAEQPMTEKEAYRAVYQVTVKLGLSFYNKDIDRYLFAQLGDGTRGKVLVSETNEVTFEVNDTWYIRDLVQVNDIESVTVKRIK